MTPPSRVSVRSLKPKPVTASLKTIVIVLTAVLRGSGVTAVITTVGTISSASVTATTRFCTSVPRFPSFAVTCTS